MTSDGFTFERRGNGRDPNSAPALVTRPGQKYWILGKVRRACQEEMKHFARSDTMSCRHRCVALEAKY